MTSRELEVLRLLALGLPNREIAGRLYLSPRTVERHVGNLEVKTGTARRAELVAYAARIAPSLPRDKIVIVNLSGRGDKDMHTVAERSGIEL